MICVVVVCLFMGMIFWGILFFKEKEEGRMRPLKEDQFFGRSVYLSTDKYEGLAGSMVGELPTN